jgi:hypothetical protein
VTSKTDKFLGHEETRTPVRNVRAAHDSGNVSACLGRFRWFAKTGVRPKLSYKARGTLLYVNNCSSEILVK